MIEWWIDISNQYLEVDVKKYHYTLMNGNPDVSLRTLLTLGLSSLNSSIFFNRKFAHDFTEYNKELNNLIINSNCFTIGENNDHLGIVLDQLMVIFDYFLYKESISGNDYDELYKHHYHIRKKMNITKRMMYIGHNKNLGKGDLYKMGCSTFLHLMDITGKDVCYFNHILMERIIKQLGIADTIKLLIIKFSKIKDNYILIDHKEEILTFIDKVLNDITENFKLDTSSKKELLKHKLMY